MENIIKEIEKNLIMVENLVNNDMVDREVTCKIQIYNDKKVILYVTTKEKRENRKQKFVFDLNQLKIA